MCKGLNFDDSDVEFLIVLLGTDPRAVQSSVPHLVGCLTPLEVEEGTAARFKVDVYGSPRPSLTWYCDGRKLTQTPRIKVCLSTYLNLSLQYL